MKNFVQPGNTLDLSAPAALSSGDVVQVGKLIGVAEKDAQSGETVAVSVVGVYSLNRNATDTFAQGDLVYWDATAKEVTTNSAAGANALLGASVEALAAGAGSIKVRLNGVAQ